MSDGDMPNEEVSEEITIIVISSLTSLSIIDNGPTAQQKTLLWDED